MHKKYRMLVTMIMVLMAVVIWLPQGAFAAGPKNVIFYIGDGMSSVQRRIPEEAYGKKLTMNTLPVVGIYTTYSSNSVVTDSAAAGTAMATGQKTENTVISLGPNKEVAYETLAEAAKRIGKSVGLLTTTRMTHATPASFGSHIDDRNKENEIAVQYLEQGFEIYMGGGWRNFIPESAKKSKRKDERDLLKEFSEKGYKVVQSKSDLIAIKIEKNTKILGLFWDSHLPYYLDREDGYYQGKVPNLSEMTEVAISVLKQNPKGFFLMIEGGRIDHACHANDPAGMVGDMVDFDNAIKVGMDFSEEDPDTLILVGGDHETGGMGMGRDGKYYMRPKVIKNVTRSCEFMGYMFVGTPDKAIERFNEFNGIKKLKRSEIKDIKKAIEYTKAKKGMRSPNPYLRPWLGFVFAEIISKRACVGWTSYAHTGQPVIMTAGGPGSENFDGFYDNTDITKKVANLWGITLKTRPAGK